MAQVHQPIVIPEMCNGCYRLYQFITGTLVFSRPPSPIQWSVNLGLAVLVTLAVEMVVFPEEKML